MKRDPSTAEAGELHGDDLNPELYFAAHGDAHMPRRGKVPGAPVAPLPEAHEMYTLVERFVDGSGHAKARIRCQCGRERVMETSAWRRLPPRGCRRCAHPSKPAKPRRGRPEVQPQRGEYTLVEEVNVNRRWMVRARCSCGTVTLIDRGHWCRGAGPRMCAKCNRRSQKRLGVA